MAGIVMHQRFLSGNPVFFSGDLCKESNKLRRRKMRYFRLVDGALYNYRRKVSSHRVCEMFVCGFLCCVVCSSKNERSFVVSCRGAISS